MQKITDYQELDKRYRQLADQDLANSKTYDEIVHVCTGGGCIACGSLNLKSELEKKLSERKLDSKIMVKATGCLGPCSKGPAVVLRKAGVFYQKVQLADLDELIDQQLVAGQHVERLLHCNEEDGKPQAAMADIKLFNQQKKVVLRRCGSIDPTRLEDYIAAGGYQAFSKALKSMTPEGIVEEMKKSGLRGRGGAGFPTALKWDFARRETSDQKYILCNADEGDPGAFMDRSILEGDPHSVIEGMAIGAYTIGASQGYIYCRAEYPLAVERLNLAINQAREAGLLGQNILGSAFSFDLEIRMGSGAFVCGEETALIASIEGKRGEPRPRPPFPAQSGLWGKPTVLNNVETFANVSAIIEKGGSWFAENGTEKSKGTKIFALAGAISYNFV